MNLANQAEGDFKNITLSLATSVVRSNVQDPRKKEIIDWLFNDSKNDPPYDLHKGAMTWVAEEVGVQPATLSRIKKSILGDIKDVASKIRDETTPSSA